MNTLTSNKPLPHVLAPIASMLAKKGLPACIDEQGLCVSDIATVEERQKIFKGIKTYHSGVGLWLNFALGDAYNALPGDYGTKTKWVEDNFGGRDAVMQIRRCAGVAHRWPHSKRQMSFSWSFYLETAVGKFGDTDREKMAEDYKAGNLTIEGIREIKREMDGGKNTDFDELDPKWWTSEFKNNLRLLIQQNGMKKTADLLRRLVLAVQNAPGYTAENDDVCRDIYQENAGEKEGSEIIKNEAVFDDFPSKQYADVGILFTEVDDAEKTLADDPEADKKESRDADQQSRNPCSPPGLSPATLPESQKSDNKNNSYCRNEPPAAPTLTFQTAGPNSKPLTRDADDDGWVTIT